MNIEKAKTLSVIVLLVVLALLTAYTLHIKSNYKELVELNKVASSEIQTWKGKDGLNRAKIEVLETQNVKTFLAFETQDSLIKLLQSEVKDMKKYLKKEGSVTIIEGETKYDTVYKSDKKYKNIFGNFITDSIHNQWITSNFGFKIDSLPDGTYKIDSTKYSLIVKNKYALTIGRENTGFLGLGKSKPFAQIKNYNPYTETTDMKTYQVDGYDNKRFSIGPSAGVTWDGSWKPYVGIGVNWAIFKF